MNITSMQSWLSGHRTSFASRSDLLIFHQTFKSSDFVPDMMKEFSTILLLDLKAASGISSSIRYNNALSEGERVLAVNVSQRSSV